MTTFETIDSIKTSDLNSASVLYWNPSIKMIVLTDDLHFASTDSSEIDGAWKFNGQTYFAI